MTGTENNKGSRNTRNRTNNTERTDDTGTTDSEEHEGQVEVTSKSLRRTGSEWRGAMGVHDLLSAMPIGWDRAGSSGSEHRRRYDSGEREHGSPSLAIPGVLSDDRTAGTPQ